MTLRQIRLMATAALSVAVATLIPAASMAAEPAPHASSSAPSATAPKAQQAPRVSPHAKAARERAEAKALADAKAGDPASGSVKVSPFTRRKPHKPPGAH
jgi:hypothetical protein